MRLLSLMVIGTGSASGEICLWQFGKKGAIAGYSPLLASQASTPTSSSSSLFSSTPQSWNANPGVNISHWGQPQAVSLQVLHQKSDWF